MLIKVIDVDFVGVVETFREFFSTPKSIKDQIYGKFL